MPLERSFQAARLTGFARLLLNSFDNLQKKTSLIRHLRTPLRDFPFLGGEVFKNSVHASTRFWLRENAGHSTIFTAPFRFTIGRRTYSGSVEKLQIGFVAGILMGRAREAQAERIL